MKLDINREIEVPKGTEVRLENGLLSIKGQKGEISKKFINPKVIIKYEQDKIIVSSKRATKREKTIIGTFVAHIENMIRGVNEPYVYKLKVCSSHFPMTVVVSEGVLSIKNFLGEKIPRTFKVKQGVTIKIEGANITVESADKDLAGQTAASIEQLCRITDKDKRVFQDGIYIVYRSGEDVM